MSTTSTQQPVGSIPIRRAFLVSAQALARHNGCDPVVTATLIAAHIAAAEALLNDLVEPPVRICLEDAR